MTELIEKLILFLMAASLILQMVPEESYKKCIRFFTGLVFMLFLLSSVFEGVNTIQDFNIKLFDLSDGFESMEDYESIFNEYYGNLAEYEDSR